MQGQVDLSSLNFYTTLGQLAPLDLGLDAEGDVMALAQFIGPDGETQRPVVLVIRAAGGFEVHELTHVPLDWPVTKAKLMMIAAPVSQADAEAKDAARNFKEEVNNVKAFFPEELSGLVDVVLTVDEEDLEAFGNELATERG